MTLYDRDLRKLEDIDDAIKEAVRFIGNARHAKAVLSGEMESFYHSKSFAAAKRSSLDLTNALAKMRRGRA